MQCDANSSVVVSGGSSASWNNYYVSVGIGPIYPDENMIWPSHIFRLYGRWQNSNNYYMLEYDDSSPDAVGTFTLWSVVNGVPNFLGRDAASNPVPPAAMLVFDGNFISVYIYWGGIWTRIIALHDGSLSWGTAGIGNGGGNDGAQFSNFLVQDANGGVDFDPYVCWGGPAPLTASQNYGACGTVCSNMTWGWDAINHNSNDVMVRGVVGAGACYDRKNLRASETETNIFPHIAGDDNEFNHNDRDFEFRMMPTDGTYLGNANRQGANHWEGAAPGDMLVEIPSMYMYPTLDSNRWANGVAPFAYPFRPSGMPLTNDGEHLGIPWSGDEVIVQGRAIWDCGHCDGGYNRSEIHPPDAIAWLHPTPGVSRTGIVWLRAFSRRPYPGDQIGATDLLQSNGHYFLANLHIPGGPSPEDIYVGPVQSDFVVDAQLQHSGICELGSSTNGDHPWACISTACQSVNLYYCPPPADLIAAEKALHYSGYFSVDARGSSFYGDTTVQIQALRDNGSTQLPYIMGAHYKVCIPECVGGVNQNGCPMPCRPPATPMSLAITSSSSSRISLSWSGSAGPIPATGYYVYRSVTSGANYARLTSTASTSWTDASMSAGARYYYVVTSWNGGGAGPVNESARSNEVTAVASACDATSCPNGCCSGDTCLPGNSTAYGCKSGGAACAAACAPGYVCSANACAYQCNATTCPQGCCSANTCEPGNSTTYGCIANGGACAASCAPGFTCSGGACYCAPTTCAAQGKNCGSIPDGCGGTLNCGTCAGGMVCGGNVCACPAGQTNCSGTCVNLSSDRYNCGSCGSACGYPQTACSAGACRCPTGKVSCCGGDICASSCPRQCP